MSASHIQIRNPGSSAGLVAVLHFSFTVSDLDRSVAWYTDVLGLELVHRQIGDNDYTRTLIGMPNAVIDAAQFKLSGVSPGASTHMLELVEYLAPPGEVLPLATNNVGVGHLAFIVDDLAREYTRLCAAGVQFRNPPVPITAGANFGGAACYFADPDGITLELLELSPQRKADGGSREDAVAKGRPSKKEKARDVKQANRRSSMSKVKQGAATLVAGVLCVTVAACGGGSGSSTSSSPAAGASSTASGSLPAKGTKVGIVFNTATDPNQQAAAKGLADKMKAAGATVTMVDANSDLAKGNQLMQNFVTQKYNDIVTVVFPASGLQAGLAAANAANIPVYQLFAFGKPKGVAGLISQTAATQETNRMVKDMGGKGSVLAFTFHPGQPCIVGEQAFDVVMKQYPGIKVQKQEVSAPGWAQDGANAAASWLQSHPKGSGPLAIWGCWDGPILGAASAVRQAGRSDVKLYGQYGEAGAIAAVAKGEEKATYWFNGEAGGAQLAAVILKNAGKGANVTPTYLSQQPVEVDASNVQQFIKEHPGAVKGG